MIDVLFDFLQPSERQLAQFGSSGRPSSRASRYIGDYLGRTCIDRLFQLQKEKDSRHGHFHSTFPNFTSLGYQSSFLTLQSGKNKFSSCTWPTPAHLQQDLEQKDETIAAVRRKGAEDVARSRSDAKSRAAELRTRMRAQAAELAELREVREGQISII